jgi:WD40 repeat protein
MPINRCKMNNTDKFGKLQFILECEDNINHLKLMRNNKDRYLCVVDNAGYLYTKQLIYNWIFKTIDESTIVKKFDCKIISNDNSTWSLDVKYPYIAVGGNHKCILINNINSNSDQVPIKENILLYGNKHNVPGICFSECGNFMASNSIDKEPKIWNINNSKLLVKVKNQTQKW